MTGESDLAGLSRGLVSTYDLGMSHSPRPRPLANHRFALPMMGPHCRRMYDERCPGL